MGYKTDYPLAYWDRTIENVEEIGINRPSTYKLFKHANCIGCLKAGRQHWYAVYCLRPDIFNEAKQAEKEIGYTIIKGISMEKVRKEFLKEMKERQKHLSNEKLKSQTFWAKVKKALPEDDIMPCDCSF